MQSPLSSAQVADRRSKAARHRRPSMTLRARLTGGPLDGVTLYVNPPGFTVGMCCVTNTGPVQVLYQRAGEDLAFRENVAQRPWGN